MKIDIWIAVAVLAAVQIAKTIFPGFWDMTSRWQWAASVLSGACFAFATSMLQGAVLAEACDVALNGAAAGLLAIGAFRALKETRDG